MNIETKEFWEKVKKDFCTSDEYLCNVSNFDKAWSNAESNFLIKKHANEFLNSTKLPAKIGGQVLFISISINYANVIRYNFIEYMINKFS